MFVSRAKTTKFKLIIAIRSTTNVGVGVSYTARSTNVLMCLLHKLILLPSAQFLCCQLLITKLFVTIYISALYKPPIVSIDDITQPMYESYNFLHDCLEQLVILVVFMWFSSQLSENNLFMWSVAVLSDQVTYFILPAHFM